MGKGLSTDWEDIYFSVDFFFCEEISVSNKHKSKYNINAD